MLCTYPNAISQNTYKFINWFHIYILSILPQLCLNLLFC